MLRDHAYLKSTLFQEHIIANMLLEQCAFQIRSWSIFDLQHSVRLLMVQDHMVLEQMVQDHMVLAKISKKGPSHGLELGIK